MMLSIVLCICTISECKAQEPGTNILQPESSIVPDDAIVVQVDEDTVPRITETRSPQKAVLFSSILPGLGQIYNRKYWKIPIIYGAGGAFLCYTIHWNTQYKKFRDAYLEGYSQPDPQPVLIDGRLYDYDILPRGRDGYRRYRDLCMLGTAVVYLLNIVDAMIDAHFFNYDVSDDLSFRITPALMDDPAVTTTFGLKFHVGF